MGCSTYLVLLLNVELILGIDFEVSALLSDVPMLTEKVSGSAVG